MTRLWYILNITIGLASMAVITSIFWFSMVKLSTVKPKSEQSVPLTNSLRIQNGNLTSNGNITVVVTSNGNIAAEAQ